LLCLLAAFPVLADDPSAWELYERGREAEKGGHMAQAYLFYAEAAAAEPKNRMYWQRARAIRTRAALEGLAMPEAPTVAAVGEAAAADADEQNFVKPEEATARDAWDASRQAPPPTLAPAGEGTRDIDLRGDSKQIWTDLAKLYDLEPIFDPDYQPMAQLRFRLNRVDYVTAMRGLQAATGTFIFPVTDKVFMVVKDTPQKRTEREPRVAVAIPLPDSVTQQDFNQAVTAVQQAIGIEKVSFDSQTKTVILRDTLPKVTAARAVFNSLMRPPAQVMVELKLMEVTRNDMLTYGVDFPKVFTLNFLTTWLNNTFTPPANIQGILTFGGGKTLMGLGIVNTVFVSQMSKSAASNLLDSSLRTTDGKAATLHIGEQYPVMTSQYVGPSSFTQAGSAYTPPPSFQFVDLGLTLKVTPYVRSLDSATLDVDAEFKELTGTALNAIPVIGNRSFKATVRLQMGEWAVVGGLMDVEQAHNIAGLAGASHVAFLNALTSTHNKTHTSDEILLVMRPVALSTPPADVDPGRSYAMGSETRPASIL
jgi:hypothetical protein